MARVEQDVGIEFRKMYDVDNDAVDLAASGARGV